ncbi:MarR family winged helix-turn-helix transcriptional regulator [Microbacterium pygmaeum]|uniref:DNA-binding transcriptional regulator, MarR family n=1 Tax=Microbacterium pygmaeum TaxID=370764 RepID=A0A1G7ZTS6_9MICO|nr:MarR family transcriptional regulator [Microbacterium pygmaeum]SDH12115.1 DNA-binding transcriptional regulator, MarR family [Microbacterium pygmaeum]
MTRSEDLQRLVVAAHALTRIAALETRNEAPAAQWRTLTILRDHGDLRLGELATLSRITQPGMTRLVSTMAEHGLVRKTADADDSRVAVVTVTEAGRTALGAWLTQLTDALAPHFSDLDDHDWDAIARTAAILSARTGSLEVAR